MNGVKDHLSYVSANKKPILNAM
ncbi:hypothetical protein [Lactococcus lactis]